MEPRPTHDACRFMRERLHGYIEFELDRSTAAFVASHLQGCVECYREKARLEAERIETLESMMTAPALQTNFAAKVRAAIEDQQSARRTKHRLLAWRFAAGILLGSLAVTLVFIALDSGRSDIPDGQHGGQPGVSIADSDQNPGSDADAVVIIASKMVPSKTDLRTGPSRTVSSEIAPDDVSTVAMTPAVDTPTLPLTVDANSINTGDLSKTIMSVGETGPCNEDTNQDGQLDLSDLAYVLACNFFPSSLDSPSSSDCDRNCFY